MMPLIRILEITLYALANFIPYLILSLYTFSNHLRFSKFITGIISFATILVQVFTRFYAAYAENGSSTNITLIRLFSYLLLFFIAVDLHLGKILFIQIIFSNIANFISIAAICIEGILFSGTVHRMYCWHPSVIMLVLHLFITLPFFLTVKRRLKPLIERNAVGYEWYYYWLIPAVFYLIWIYHVYGTGLDTTTVILQPRNIIFLLVVNAGASFIYYIVVWSNNQMVKNLELEQKNHYLDVEKLEYHALHDRIEETRRARHDLRHHILVMNDYLQEQEYDKLKEYLSNYYQSIPEMPSIFFCQNRAVNRLVLFFATKAKESNIDFQAKLSIPDDLNMSEEDISVLLGNLLENALDACMEQKDGMRKIIISGNGDKNSLFFTIDNTFDNQIKQTCSGHFLTTKKNGSGLGIESVKHIVARYNGVFTAEPKENMFYVSFMLNL